MRIFKKEKAVVELIFRHIDKTAEWKGGEELSDDVSFLAVERTG